MAVRSFSMENLSQKLPKIEDSSTPPSASSLLSSYLGLSFAVFLGFLPKSSISYVSSLQSRNRILSLKLFQAEDQLRSLRSRRKEDSKANARVVEIFASHRNTWQQEEKRLLHQIDVSNEEIERLRARIGETESKVGRLEREVRERDEMLDFMARKVEGEGEGEEEEEEEEEKEVEEFGSGRVRVSEGAEFGREEEEEEMDEMAAFYAAEEEKKGFVGSEVLAAMVDSKRWMERSSSGLQDMQYDSAESTYNMKNFVVRRESPWKVDGDSTVSSKLKLLEQELVNLEKVGKGDLSKVSTLMRKQAKRYQSLTGKIDDLCRRMQVSDPCEPTLSPEFRTQRQSEFLLEAVRLKHRATETRQKLSSLQAETSKTFTGNEVPGHAKQSTKRSLEMIGNNLKEIQRNLEIWLARITGDIEGILARDGAFRVSDYYLSPSAYPFVR